MQYSTSRVELNYLALMVSKMWPLGIGLWEFGRQLLNLLRTGSRLVGVKFDLSTPNGNRTV